MVPISASTATTLAHVEPWLSSRNMTAPQKLILIRGAWHEGVAGGLRELGRLFQPVFCKRMRLTAPNCRLQRNPESLSEALLSRPRDCDGAAATEALDPAEVKAAGAQRSPKTA
jgi:hypothetical protein